MIRGLADFGWPRDLARSPQNLPSEMEFSDLGLAPWLTASCRAMGLRKPTPIQAACIGPALAGRDVLGSAETGSGKTAAFALPVLQALSVDPYGVFAIVLSPARELAMQISDQFSALGAHMNVRVCVVVGGRDMMTQALELAARPHVVVGTPGRLADHLRSSGTCSVVAKARFLVIDEADRLLELGFAKDVSFVVKQMPVQRQTLLFSATMSTALTRLQRLALKQPFLADLAPTETVPTTLVQEYVFVPANVRDVYLVHLLRQVIEAQQTAIVFTSSCRVCEMLTASLIALDVPCASLHSQQPQQRRVAAIGRFKQGTLRLLVATDVASRGIDIPAVEVVINHNVPALPKDYVHRCGRTARAGRAGRAVTLVSQYDVELLLSIEQHVGSKLLACEFNEEEVLGQLTEVASAQRTALLQLTDNGFLAKEKERRAKKRAERTVADITDPGANDQDDSGGGDSQEMEHHGSSGAHHGSESGGGGRVEVSFGGKHCEGKEKEDGGGGGMQIAGRDVVRGTKMIRRRGGGDGEVKGGSRVKRPGSSVAERSVAGKYAS